MDRAITLQLVLTLMLLVLYPTAESKWIPHHPLPRVDPPPLCASQLALVNHACAMLPYTRVPPPSPLTPDSRHHHHHGHDHGHGHDHDHDHGHGHGHGHRHSKHGHKETTIEEDCCRWLKELDDVCVCELLVRLPPFLTRPVHNYTVGVDDICNITFACGSRLVPL
ncbi:UNVERIFIED_CONTAM: hypothetical protein Sradi_0284500 [Sesamum radiatum]|uniref:Bifunctional inhibitor/plant lipid transfer protein/seed storage helical domain-containing protein n=1 Tax=Sesamum radiatum TaxID=300843 RepID=A0AAW2W4K9_SESRA